VVSPDNTNGDVILAELECVPSVVKYKVNTENSTRPRPNKRKAEEELLDPEEEEKRKMRRNRNRLAAARCRQKRLDQIETLQVEVNNWEKKNRSLEEEVAALKADKEELQYILAAHRNTCSLQVKAEPVTEEESPVYVEVQPKEETVKLQRPGTLSLPITVNSIEGVSIDTPSNGILSFNTLLEGKTGLTPTNILSPTSLWGGVKVSSSLNTPTCGSQERRLIVTDLLSPSTHGLQECGCLHLIKRHKGLITVQNLDRVAHSINLRVEVSKDDVVVREADPLVPGRELGEQRGPHGL